MGMRIHIITALLIIIDQVIKTVILKFMPLIYGYSIINGFCYIHPSINTGISFGYLKWIPMYLLVLISILSITFIIHYTYTTRTQFDKVIHILLIAGSISNLIDRLFYGYIVDMFSICFFGKGLFVCNVADIYVTLGCISALWREYKSKN